MDELAERVRHWDVDATALPLPGGGDTPARHDSLLAIGRRDLSSARIAEAHTDALAILAEAKRAPQAGGLYGVWAADTPNGRLIASRAAGGWRLDGVKQYCSGSTFATSALVTARAGEDVLLFDVSLDCRGVRALASTWATPALDDTATAPMAFEGVTLGAKSLVGGENWYLSRPGFWHGAIGPAACWAGGALSLVDAAVALNRRDPHSRAQVGAMLAAAWGMSAVLAEAGREIDADPLDRKLEARRRALKVRHLIERWCTEILDRFGRATGPQLLAHDVHVVRQHMALAVYIRQCHGERDLETIPA